MTNRGRVAVGLLTVLALAGIGAAGSHAQTTDARLQGTFALSGHITAAAHVSGERVGQAVSRTWTFQPQCPTGPCSSVTLTRSLAPGSDTLTMNQTAPGSYVGSGSFDAPLRCGGRVHRRGELVPFTITLTITAETESSAGPLASTIAATYMNPKRQNLTRCVLPPSHDAATYSGSLVSEG